MNVKILLVDDDPAARTLVRRTLECAGHRVVALSNGRDAARASLRMKPDLVIVDILMPDLDGYETMLQIRERQPEVPFVFISAGGQGPADLYLANARLLGAARALEKPFSREALLDAVAAVLASVAEPERGAA